MSPPRFAIWLLEQRLPAAERDFFVGDLVECFHHDVALERHARLRFWRETILALFTYWPPSPRLRIAPVPRDGFMSRLLSDFRQASRTLARAPLFAAIAILTLAVGIGATSAIFSVVHPILFDAPPYPRSDRIATLWDREKDGSESNMGYLTFRDLQRESRSFSSMAAMSYWSPILVGEGDAERLNGQRVTQGFFTSLGVRLMLGRDFRTEEDHQEVNRVVILGHDLWQRRFGGDSSIVGRNIQLSGFTYSVVGILPQTFESLLSPQTQIWGPLGYEASLPWACRTCRHLRVIGRLHDGVTPQQAAGELSRLSENIVRAFPTEYPGPGVLLTPFREYLTRGVRPALVAVFGAVAFLLLIACANVVNLFLGRSVERESEFAVRAALGAGRARLVRQLVTESLALALVGGALGVALAIWGVKALIALSPPSLPRLDRIEVDGTVFLFTLLVSIATGVFAGLVPALATVRRDLGVTMKQGARNLSRGARHRVRGGLVVAEMALALMLLVGAGLLVRSLDRLLAVNTGFEMKDRLTMELQVSGSRYADDDAVRRLYLSLLDGVRAVPGVRSATITSQLPLSGDFDTQGIHFESKPNANPEDDPSAFRFAVSPSHVRTMGMRLVRGRDLTESDAESAPPVLLINETMARLDFAGADPIGQRVKMGGTDRPWLTVVGVVGDVKHEGLDKGDERQVYVPFTQWWFADSRMVLVVHSDVEPATMAVPLRRVVRELDPAIPVARVATMEEVSRGSTAQRRFALLIFEVFAGVALILAAAGIYGVLAGSVNERTREIGIRSALGAPRERILALVVKQGMVLAVGGVVIGLVGALAMSRALGSLLFDIQAYDPLTLIAMSLGLMGVALAAVAIPAWRATRVDALVALRES